MGFFFSETLSMQVTSVSNMVQHTLNCFGISCHFFCHVELDEYVIYSTVCSGLISSFKLTRDAILC